MALQVPCVTTAQRQSMWTAGACPGEMLLLSALCSNSVHMFFFCLFLLHLLYDKCYSEAVLPFAHFSQLSIISSPVNSGLVWTCLSCCSSDFHHGAGKSDGFKWLEGAVKQVGISLVPQSECLGSLNTFPFSVLMG